MTVSGDSIYFSQLHFVILFGRLRHGRGIHLVELGMRTKR